MNRSYLVLLVGLLFVAGGLHAQSAYKKVATAACACAEQEQLDGLSEQDRNMKLSLCLMKGFQEHSGDPAFSDLDPTNQSAMQDLAAKVSMEMAGVCPSVMMQVVESTQTPKSAGVFEGTFQRIEGDKLATVILKDGNDRDQQFLWLNYFEGAESLEKNASSLSGKKVRVTFVQEDMYSPKFSEYVSRKVIAKMEVLD